MMKTGTDHQVCSKFQRNQIQFKLRLIATGDAVLGYKTCVHDEVCKDQHKLLGPSPSRYSYQFHDPGGMRYLGIRNGQEPNSVTSAYDTVNQTTIPLQPSIKLIFANRGTIICRSSLIQKVIVLCVIH